MTKSICLSSLIFSAAMIALSPAAHSQTTAPASEPLTRAEVRMDRDDFLKMHRYDEKESEWMTTAPSTSDLSRAEVKTARNQFLTTHRWNESTDTCPPIAGVPRDMSTMTREEVKMERMQFARTHAWDNKKSMWVMKPMRSTQ